MADTQVKDETAAGTLLATDRFYIVRDPTGTPVDRYGTPVDIAAYIFGGGSLIYQGTNRLDIHNTTNTQEVAFYKTRIDASNYDRLAIRNVSDNWRIVSEKLGSPGASTFSLHVGANRFLISDGAYVQLDRDTYIVGGFFPLGDLTIANTKNFILSATTGTKIGTATTQKLGFWNATPVVQPNGTGETVGFTAGSGTAVNDASTFTGNVGATAYRISDIVKALKNVGLLAA
jgi:hypothetical protein